MISVMEERARRVVADVLGLAINEVCAETSYTTVACWDSVAMINIAMAVESEFEVEIGIEDVTRLDSMANVMNVLREKGIL